MSLQPLLEQAWLLVQSDGEAVAIVVGQDLKHGCVFRSLFIHVPQGGGDHVGEITVRVLTGQGQDLGVGYGQFKIGAAGIYRSS